MSHADFEAYERAARKDVAFFREEFPSGRELADALRREGILSAKWSEFRIWLERHDEPSWMNHQKVCVFVKGLWRTETHVGYRYIDERRSFLGATLSEACDAVAAAMLDMLKAEAMDREEIRKRNLGFASAKQAWLDAISK